MINVSTDVFTGHSRHPSSARGVVKIWNLPHFYPIVNISVVWLVFTGTCTKSLPNVILRFCQLKHIYLLKFLLVSPTYHLSIHHHKNQKVHMLPLVARWCKVLQWHWKDCIIIRILIIEFPIWNLRSVIRFWIHFLPGLGLTEIPLEAEAKDLELKHYTRLRLKNCQQGAWLHAKIEQLHSLLIIQRGSGDDISRSAHAFVPKTRMNSQGQLMLFFVKTQVTLPQWYSTVC